MCDTPHFHPCDTVLPQHVIVDTLLGHGVDVLIREADGVVMAWEEAVLISRPTPDAEPTVEDVSGWVTAPVKVHSLAAWLGY